MSGRRPDPRGEHAGRWFHQRWPEVRLWICGNCMITPEQPRQPPPRPIGRASSRRVTRARRPRNPEASNGLIVPPTVRLSSLVRITAPSASLSVHQPVLPYGRTVPLPRSVRRAAASSRAILRGSISVVSRVWIPRAVHRQPPSVFRHHPSAVRPPPSVHRPPAFALNSPAAQPMPQGVFPGSCRCCLCAGPAPPIVGPSPTRVRRSGCGRSPPPK